MTLTTLDPQTALIVVNLQKGMTQDIINLLGKRSARAWNGTIWSPISSAVPFWRT